MDIFFFFLISQARKIATARVREVIFNFVFREERLAKVRTLKILPRKKGGTVSRKSCIIPRIRKRFENFSKSYLSLRSREKAYIERNFETTIKLLDS